MTKGEKKNIWVSVILLLLLLLSVSVGFIIFAAFIVSVLILNVLIFLVIKSRDRRLPRGISSLIDARGRTLTTINLEGQAIIHGEIWNVYSKRPIDSDCGVHVVNVKDLKLEVQEDNIEQQRDPGSLIDD